MSIDWETVADAIVLAEVVVFFYVLFRSVQAFIHLQRAVGDAEAHDWLLRGVRNFVGYAVVVAVYLLVLTGLGAMFGPLSEHFPLLRPINGALLLGLMSGGYFLDKGIRTHVNGNGHSLEQRNTEAAERTADATERIADQAGD